MSKKTFEELFTELQQKAAKGDPATSRTAELVGKGVHAIGKKVVEEAAEVWMAAEYEGKEAAAVASARTPGELVGSPGLAPARGAPWNRTRRTSSSARCRWAS
ncbi:Phosphoribosyl-ATP pyrophosphatase [Streptomyces alboniger]